MQYAISQYQYAGDDIDESPRRPTSSLHPDEMRVITWLNTQVGLIALTDHTRW